ncbi:MAG: hypothetical protein A2139_11155 [Desulfobacca sp. RBG_16_60_12]|nr:MAG: hypothetical protein A2139_11155 [Desulfobacca sp. RBG_16_60_12]
MSAPRAQYCGLTDHLMTEIGAENPSVGLRLFSRNGGADDGLPANVHCGQEVAHLEGGCRGAAAKPGGDAGRHLSANGDATRAIVHRRRVAQAAGQLRDRVLVPERKAPSQTPNKVAAVRRYAGYPSPALGYKRQAWAMVDEGATYLRPNDDLSGATRFQFV